MQRLIDEPPEGAATVVRAVQLLRSAQAAAADDRGAATRKGRVRAALARRAARPVWVVLLRPVLTMALLALLGSAALAGALFLRGARRARPLSLEQTHPMGPPPAPAASSAPAPSDAPTPIAMPSKAVAASPKRGPIAAPRPSPSARDHSQAPAVVNVPGDAEAKSAEAALVLAAMRALRRERDPARAAVLLADYMRLYPRGSLSEEALALSIEAAAAAGGGDAAALGASYLQRFPAGRFRDLAQRAIRQPVKEAADD